jgi:glutathione S-transferase
MIWTALVTCAGLIVYLVQATNVSVARRKCGIAAPAIVGDPAFERVFRVHQNTLEALVTFLPALWLFAWYVSDLWAGVLGLVWVVGRIVYMIGYYADAKKRGPGATISGLASMVLLLGALIGIVIFALQG